MTLYNYNADSFFKSIVYFLQSFYCKKVFRLQNLSSLQDEAFVILAVALISEATFLPIGKISLPLTQRQSKASKLSRSQDKRESFEKKFVDINDDVHGFTRSILDMISPEQQKLKRSRRSVQSKCAKNFATDLFPCAKPTANNDFRQKVISPDGVKGQKSVNNPVENDGEVRRDELLALLETEGLGKIDVGRYYLFIPTNQ